MREKIYDSSDNNFNSLVFNIAHEKMKVSNFIDSPFRDLHIEFLIIGYYKNFLSKRPSVMFTISLSEFTALKLKVPETILFALSNLVMVKVPVFVELVI